MSDLMDKISRLPPEQRAVFETRLREGLRGGGGEDREAEAGRASASAAGEFTAATGPAEGLWVSGAENEALASTGQERLWRLSRRAPDSAAWNVPVVLDLTGPLDVAALRRAWLAVLRRHAVLRTTPMSDSSDSSVLGKGVPE